MNKSQIIWGVICLVVAATLAILNLTLPPESLMFQIGDRNMPWVPPVVFAGVGIVLLLTAGKKEEPIPPVEHVEQVKPGQDLEKKALNKRLESVAWGLFLIMLGGFALVPDESIPKGVWSIGIGVIHLGNCWPVSLVPPPTPSPSSASSKRNWKSTTATSRGRPSSSPRIGAWTASCADWKRC